MEVDVLLGLQWGDEGKGKIVDVLCPQYDLIARFQGGPNAGHTLEFNNKKFVLNTIPSGIFNINSINLIGNGVVIDPASLKKEIDNLATHGVDAIALGNLLISKKAHVILPTHQILDAAYEHAMGHDKIGSTLKGIGPVYQDKTGRNGLRIGDLIAPDFIERYQRIASKHKQILSHYSYEYDLEAREKAFFEGVELIKKLPLVEGEYLINDYINSKKKILAEGAQGSMLDIDFGSYPFVTSSSTIAAGACTGLGVSPAHIGQVIGIFKAYCTRVGGGPFPTELLDQTGEDLRRLGHEFGATTGRPRRCGWIDLPALKYAIMLNGVTSMVMTKADVLSGFEEIKVCTHYEYNGKIHDRIPYDICQNDIKPVYKSFKGWSADLTGITKPAAIPIELKDYVKYLEAELGVPIKYLSVGPDRTQTLQMHA